MIQSGYTQFDFGDVMGDWKLYIKVLISRQNKKQIISDANHFDCWLKTASSVTSRMLLQLKWQETENERA